MNPNTNLRIKALRTIMEKEGIAAFIIPSTDPHLSEYVAPHWESRKWIGIHRISRHSGHNSP